MKTVLIVPVIALALAGCQERLGDIVNTALSIRDFVCSTHTVYAYDPVAVTEKEKQFYDGWNLFVSTFCPVTTEPVTTVIVE